MSWLGLRHKGVEVLYPEEWNKVVDGLDILKSYTDASVKKRDLTYLDSDIIPKEDNVYVLGDPLRAWKEIQAHYGYFKDNAYVQGKPVLKDGDPVITKEFIDKAKSDVEKIYSLVSDVKREVEIIYDLVSPPVDLDSWRVSVGTSPIPLSDVDMVVKKIHVKVPTWALYLVYIGSSSKQDFILEKGDKEVLDIPNPKKVYVRSLGNVTIFVMVEK
mgnify:CR=1 FL=1